MMQYLTPTDFDIAKANGISEKTLYVRVYRLGWDKKKAISKKITPRRDLNALVTDEIKAVLELNDIPISLFKMRIKRGWSVEKATTESKGNYHERVRRKYPLELIQKAESNGVSYNTFIRRVKEGWDMYEASEVKPLSKTEAARLSKSGGYIISKEEQR